MKTYKTWEVIKMLSENPNLKFRTYCSDVFKSENGYIVFENIDCIDGFDGNFTGNEEWTLIQEPVDFMTAVKSGKKIKVEHILASHLDITKKYLTLKNLLDTLCYSYPSDAICDILTEGKFYIEEQEDEDE
ncbi:hypothetical protein [Clostridium cadaveris]|uniref:hypothetical protein n=1 Tax=Clostridium cadaveris TaxID=1529 RepID=UPI0015B72149|nr:hypothetical protein [Clostridium cadaveris]NWK12990.1 hypothetical protein [Clostridium cadaveris]